LAVFLSDRVDALKTPIIVGEMEKQFDLTWVEEPARRWDFLGLKRVSNAIRSAVCAGESLATPGDFLPHFHHHALDIVQLGLGNGGITGALQPRCTASRNNSTPFCAPSR